jgi:hypothetical protein
MIPNSLNIRKALELEVPISEVFRIDTSPQGNKIAMDAHEEGVENFLIKNTRAIDTITAEDGVMYSTTKTIHKINESLDAYVYDSYLIYPNEDDGGKLYTDKTTEIDFLNNKMLSVDEFCRNVMDAQAFSGFHKKNIFKYSFVGIGNFTMSEYAELHQMATQSNVHFIDFFVFHKNVLSSINFFLSGLCENDINSQKEYLTEKELSDRIEEAKKQRKLMSELSGK